MKVLKKIIISIVSIVMVVLVCASLIISSAYDTSNNSNADINNNPKDITTLINDYAVDALDNTVSTNQIGLHLTENNTNYLLSSIRNMINIPYITISAIYAIYNDDGSVSFEAPILAVGFPSCVKGKIGITLNDEGSLQIDIYSISIGRLTTTSFILKTLLKIFVNLDDITKSLKENGIYVTLKENDGTYSAIMNKSQMKETISVLLNVDGIDDLLNAIIETVVGDTELFNLLFNDNGYIGVDVNLVKMTYNGLLSNDLYKGSNNINTVKEQIVTLFNNKDINYENLSVAFDYLVRGYDSLEDNYKEIIDTLSFTSIGINNNKEYEGIVSRSKITMLKIILDAISPDISNIVNIIFKGYYDVTISEDNLNDLLNEIAFIGTSFAFIDESSKVANITISSLYSELLDEKLNMYLVVDINGKYINALVKASVVENKDALVSLSVDSLYLGEKEVNQVARTYLLNYLEVALANEEYLSVDSSKNMLLLDLTPYIEQSFFKSLISAGLSKISVTVSSKNDGKLILRLAK